MDLSVKINQRFSDCKVNLDCFALVRASLKAAYFGRFQFLGCATIYNAKVEFKYSFVLMLLSPWTCRQCQLHYYRYRSYHATFRDSDKTKMAAVMSQLLAASWMLLVLEGRQYLLSFVKFEEKLATKSSKFVCFLLSD